MSVPVVTVFSDFTCPFCYVTEAALWRRAEEGAIEVRYRAYELYPSPAPLPRPDESEWREALEPLARDTGVELAAPEFRPRTIKSHEAALFAAEAGVGTDFRRAIFQAYWRDGRDIGRIDVLTDVGSTLGLDAEEMKIVLDIDRFHDQVVHDGEVAGQLRIPGAPTLFIGTGPSATVLLGAQSAAALDEALAVR